MNSNQLLKIGNELASTWGGECYDVNYDEYREKYIFYCVECGEYFYTELDKNGIEEWKQIIEQEEK